MDIVKKFIEYTKVYTTSNEASRSTPSSKNQLVLLKKLYRELKELGLNAEMDKYGRVYAHLEGNPKYDTIGLCAHVDTASECSGKNVKPQVHTNYDGKDLPIGNGYTLTTKEFPELKTFKGCSLITTDGSTLLGADDKAGVAIIMKLASLLVKKKIERRRPLSILFTPDEEIGRGPDHFNLKKFNCKFAYTIDGGDIHEISYENFNAATAIIKVKGIAIHPGDAKDKMVNASLVLLDFINNLPKDKIPAKTSGYEGFNHLLDMKSDVENAEATFIIRNHDLKLLATQKKEFENAKRITKKNYPKAEIELKIIDSYRNMKEVIDKHPEVLKTIEQAFKDANQTFYYAPTRGGTDGARFSFLGCPCPNLGTGSRNHHGRKEYAIKEEMEDMVNILTHLFVINK